MLQSFAAEDKRFSERFPGDLVERQDGCPGIMVAKHSRSVLVLWACSEQGFDFSRMAFPISRHVMPGIVANDLVNVQPMSIPTNKLFYIDYTYGCRKWWQRIGDVLVQTWARWLKFKRRLENQASCAKDAFKAFEVCDSNKGR